MGKSRSQQIFVVFEEAYYKIWPGLWTLVDSRLWTLDSGLWTPDFFSRFLNEKKEKIQLFLKKENKMKIKNFKTFKK